MRVSFQIKCCKGNLASGKTLLNAGACEWHYGGWGGKVRLRETRSKIRYIVIVVGVSN